jgi:hypothetical protein
MTRRRVLRKLGRGGEVPAIAWWVGSHEPCTGVKMNSILRAKR